MKSNDPTHVPGIMSPVPIEVDHKPCANNLSHVWQQWDSYGQPLRKCKWCNMLEAHGTGGWSEVP